MGLLQSGGSGSAVAGELLRSHDTVRQGGVDGAKLQVRRAPLRVLACIEWMAADSKLVPGSIGPCDYRHIHKKRSLRNP